jgi:hypothetical protein
MFLSDDTSVTCLRYPILSIPDKVKSIKLERTPTITGKLAGIKGQYLLFENGEVLNIRTHTGYEVEIVCL